MFIVYPGMEIPKNFKKSIFLAGPASGPDWRREAIKALDDMNFDGVVFYPDSRRSTWHLPSPWVIRYSPNPKGFEEQVAWEKEALNRSDQIVIWITRDINNKNYGLTTNVEFGTLVKSQPLRIACGSPPGADKVRYLKQIAADHHVPWGDSLVDTLALAVDRIGEGVAREGGETCIPLYAYRHGGVRQWLDAIKSAGNRLDHARVDYTLVVAGGRFLLSLAIKADIHITDEGRNKDNETVFIRPDTTHVCAYHVAKDGTVRIVVVDEARSPSRNKKVCELPGGSSWKPGSDPAQVGIRELKQETGIEIADPSRFRVIGALQLNATFSTHQAFLMLIQLTDEEAANVGGTHGNAAETEVTHVRLLTTEQILAEGVMDWASLGQISVALGLFKGSFLCRALIPGGEA